MKDYTLKHELYLVVNTLNPAFPVETATDVTNWRLHSNAKYLFNLYEYLDAIGRLDILEMHYNAAFPDMEIRGDEYTVLSGKPRSMYWRSKKHTPLDQELAILIKDPANAAIWDQIKHKNITWKKQRIFEFVSVKHIQA